MSYLFEQVAQLVKKLSEVGWTKQDLTLLGQAGVEKLSNILLYLRGQMELVRTKYIVDFSADPTLPFNGAEVVKHALTLRGNSKAELELIDDGLYIDGQKVVLHLSQRQMGDKKIVGHELRKELEGGKQVFLNSNVLDYLYEHPELFPEHWKKDENGETRYIFFWGSIFQDPSYGLLCVGYLSWHGGSLRRHYYWLSDDWDRRDPGAVLANN